MSAELFFIAPADLPAEPVLAALRDALAANEVAALLLPRGARGETDYKSLCKAVIPVAQQAGAAVLVEGEPGFVRLVGADGLHVPGGIRAVREAIDALKPELIVGCGDIHSRDDAMRKGELAVDYILFGPLSGAISSDEREMARWWAQTMEVPSILSDPNASPDAFEAEGCEFIGLPLRATEPAS